MTVSHNIVCLLHVLMYKCIIGPCRKNENKKDLQTFERVPPFDCSWVGALPNINRSDRSCDAGF